MPKSKFDAFYYGIGMKLDEASVDEAGRKLEGKLNKVVDNVTKNLTTVTDAVAKGVKDVDTKKLVSSIVEAQKELQHFQDFDPSKLQKQIDALNITVESLSTNLSDVATQLKDFTGNVTSRLGQIEIKTAKQGKDALKADLKEMKTLAQGFNNILASGEKVDTSALDRYFQKIKAGFASLKASGNPMEVFADKELANYFIDLTNILRQMGAPVDDLRADFFELTSTFKGFFSKSDATGAQTIFKNVGYQIESVTSELRKAKAELADYESQMAKLSARTKTTGFDIVIDDDKNLSFEQKIQKIKEYGDIAAELDYGDEWATATRNQIALIQAAEKELSKSLKTDAGKDMLAKWQKAFGTYDLTDKLSTGYISDYVDFAQQELERLQTIHAQTQENIKKFQADIGRLQATEKATSSKKTKQTSKSTTQKQQAEGVVVEVQAKIKINETEWAKTINAALSNLEKSGKIKPVKIPVATTQGETLRKIQERARQIREMTLANPKDEGGSDIKSFNNKFNKFLDNLKTKKQELQNYLKQDWQKALQDAFTFKLEVLGLDKKVMTDNIAGNILPIVDAINTVIEKKPIIFYSNIDTLVEEIKTKLQDIKIDIGAGNLNVNPQGLSNVNLIVNGVAGRSVGTTPPITPPVEPPEPPASPVRPSTTSSGDIDKQAIYNNAIDKITKWMDGFTDPGKALELVKKQAQVLYKRLQDAGEGTQEYYEAQIQLAVLLGKWRGTIGGRYAKEGFRVPGVGKRWDQYLVESGIIPDPKNSKVIGGMSALETAYGLKKPSGKTKPSESITAKAMQDAEQQTANQLEAGRKIIENYIKLAKWAKALGPISEGADIEIRADDFKDKDSIWRNGRNYTKEDIGKTAPGRKITFEELDAFIAEYENAESEEDRQLFNFLKNLIDAYKGNQQRLDSLLDELSDSDVVGRYEFADNKKESLATDTQSAYKTIMSKKGSKRAQQHLTDVFAKYNIDLSELPSAETYAAQWQIIEQQIIGRKGLDFEGLMSELGSLKGNVGKTYENFMTLLKVSRAYMLASNSLGTIGQEASNIVRGTKASKDIYRKEWDNTTGRWHYTDEKIGEKQEIIVKGLRQELSGLAAVFIDELGSAIYGFGAGEGIVDDKNYMSGSSESYSKIITFLTNALNQAAEIAIDTRKRDMKGYENVTKWNADEYTKRQNRPIEEYKDWTTASTEKSELGDRIQRLKEKIEKDEEKLAGLEKEIEDAGISSDNRDKVSSLSSAIASKQSNLTSQKSKASSITSAIEALNTELNSPLYEDITAQLLEHKDTLYTLQKSLSQKQRVATSDDELQEVEKLKEEILKEENMIKTLEKNASSAKVDASGEKSKDLIAKEEAELVQLREQLNKLENDAQYKTNKDTLDRLIEEKEFLSTSIERLQDKIRRMSEDSQGKITPEQSDLMKQRDALAARAAEVDGQIKSLPSNVVPYKDEIDYISKLIATKEHYIAGLNNIGFRQGARTKDEINTVLDGKLEELAKTNEDITKLEGEITSLESQLMQIGDETTRQVILDIVSKIAQLKGTIERNKNQLNADKQKYESANDDIKYNKSYDQAVTALPKVSNELKEEQALYQLASKVYANMREVGLVQAKASSQAEYEALLKVALPLEELNKKLLNGKMTEKEYVDQIVKAYTTLLGISKEEAEKEGLALKDQILRIQKLQEEKNILEEIIRTQKPVEQPAPQPTSQDGEKPKDKTPGTSQPAGSGAPAISGGTSATTIDGGILLNLDNSGLAKDTTVRAIYDLLSVKKNGDVDSQIEEIKKAIAAKEEETRAKAEEERKNQETEAKKKKDEEEAARKVAASKKAEEKKKAQEAKTKEAQKKAQEAESAQKKAEAEAAKKKPKESKKPAVEEKPKSTTTTKPSKTTATSSDELLDIIGKSGDEFWKAYRTTMQEIQAGQRVFREHSVKLNKGSVTGVTRGLMAMTSGLPTNDLDTYGHLHPRDSLYSAQDFKGMKARRTKNANYNTDFLLTPNYIYKLDELKNASIESLEAVRKQFEEVESLEISGDLGTKVKESYLHNFAQQNGVKFNKMSVNADGTVSDITQQVEVFGKDVLDKILELGKINKQIVSSFANKQSNTDEHKNLVTRRDNLVQELLTNELYKQVAPKNFAEKTKEALFHNNKTYKSVDATLIQEAVDFGFDLSLFVDTIKDFFVQMQKLGEVVPANSPLEKIKTYIDDISKLPVDSAERKNLIEQMKPYILDVFKKNVNPRLDTRDDMLGPLKEIAKLDQSGQINKVIQRFAPKDSGDNSEVNFAKMTIEELKTELARLEALRDSGEVDPRFATAEKQDVIIGLLKNGINVNSKTEGKTGSGGGNKEKAPRLPQMPNVAKASIQAEEIDKLTNINKDSSLYQQYAEAKESLNEAISSVTAKGKDRTKDDVDQIRALLGTVTSLGKQIIKTSQAFDQFKERGGKSFASTITDVDALKNKMFELASENALSSKMLMRDISYDDMTQKMSYNLIDLEGNVTRVTMAYNDLLGAILTTSDKTTNSASKIYSAIEGEMVNRVGVNDTIKQAPIFEQSSQYQLYINAYNAMMKAQDDLRIKGEMATKEERENLISLTNAVASTRSEFEKLVQASIDFDAKIQNRDTDIKNLSPGFDTKLLEQEMKSFVLSQDGLTQSQKEMIESTWVFKNAQDGATYSVRQGKDQLASMSVIFDQGTQRIGKYTIETKKYQTGMEKFMTSLKGKWQEVARYLMSFGSLYRVWAVLRQGVTYIKEIDTALTELKKVTNETEETYEKFLNTAAKTADKVGSTVKEIVNSTADWARLNI